MTDDRTVRQAMAEMGISVGEVAARGGVDRSYVSKQLSGDRPLQSCVKVALVQALDARGIAALPHVARLLRRYGEDGAAEACEQIWGGLREPAAAAHDGVFGAAAKT